MACAIGCAGKFTSFAFADYLKKENRAKANVVNELGNKIFKMCVGNFLKLFYDGCGMVAVLSAEKPLKMCPTVEYVRPKKMLATNELWFFLVVFCLAKQLRPCPTEQK